MNQLIQVSALVGAALPLLVAVLNRCHWQARTKSLVAFGACALAAALAAVVEGTLTWSTYGTALPVVFVAAQASYAGLWKPTQVAPRLEEATTPGGRTDLPEPVMGVDEARIVAEWRALREQPR